MFNLEASFMSKHLLLISISLLLSACAVSREQVLLKQMDTLVVPAMNEFKKCDVISNPPNKFECSRKLLESLEKIYSDNPIKTILVTYAIELQELALNFDKNRIDYREYELGKTKARNKLDRDAESLRAQERSMNAKRQSNALEDFSNELRNQNNNSRMRQMETELLQQQQRLQELESRKTKPCSRLGC
jgi:hypothetical protein